MRTYTSFARQMVVALAAVAITASLLTASFTTAPQRTSVITVLA